MAGLEEHVRRGSEGDLERAAVEGHIAEAPLRVFRSELIDYHSFRARPRERVSIDDAIETLRTQGKRFGWYLHDKPTLEEQKYVIHALGRARNIAHIHDSAPKVIQKLDDIDTEIKAKDLDKEVQSKRLRATDIMRQKLLLNVLPAEKKDIEWTLFTSEKLISQVKGEKKKIAIVADLQTLLASLLLAQKYYFVTFEQYIDIKEEISRVAQRLAYDEIIKESKLHSS